MKSNYDMNTETGGYKRFSPSVDCSKAAINYTNG